MPQFVSEKAETIRSDPTEGSSIELMVRVKSDSTRAAEGWITNHDGYLIDSLDHGLLEIELPEVLVSALCVQPYVLSVESVEVQDRGN